MSCQKPLTLVASRMLSREARVVAAALLGASGAFLLYLAWRRYARVPSLPIKDRAVGMLLGGAIGDAKGIAYDGQKVFTI